MKVVLRTKSDQGGSAYYSKAGETVPEIDLDKAALFDIEIKDDVLVVSPELPAALKGKPWEIIQVEVRIKQRIP